MASNDPTDTGGLFVGRRPGTAPLKYRAQPVTAGQGCAFAAGDAAIVAGLRPGREALRGGDPPFEELKAALATKTCRNLESSATTASGARAKIISEMHKASTCPAWP